MLTTVPKPPELKNLLFVIIVDALDILFVIVIVENKTNDKDPTLVVIITITITGTGITTRTGTEMDALLIAIPITETVLVVATISVLGADLEIIIIEAEMMITIALIKTPQIGHLLLIIEVLIISHKTRLRHPLLPLINGKRCLITHLLEVLWLPTFMKKPKIPILFRHLLTLHLLSVIFLCRANPTKLL